MFFCYCSIEYWNYIICSHKQEYENIKDHKNNLIKNSVDSSKILWFISILNEVVLECFDIVWLLLTKVSFEDIIQIIKEILEDKNSPTRVKFNILHVMELFMSIYHVVLWVSVSQVAAANSLPKTKISKWLQLIIVTILVNDVDIYDL